MADAQAENSLTTAEAAEKLGVTIRTIQLWCDAGMLDVSKTPGGHRRISSASVQLLARRRATPTRPGHSTAPGIDILVIEDDTTLHKLYGAWLEGLPGVRHTSFTQNAFSGLMEIGQAVPDLLLLDLGLPGVDGYRLIRSLRAEPSCANLLIVIVTGMSEAEARAKDSLPQDVRVVTKPLRLATLTEIVRSASQSRSSAP